jgi:DNA-binding NarL/FixJ family response regulator
MRRNHPERVRVLIVGDAKASNDSIKGLLPPEFEIVATGHDDETQPLSRGAIELKPDVILIDIAVAIQDEFKAVHEVIRRLPHARIVLYPNEGGRRSCSAEVTLDPTADRAPHSFVSRTAADPGLTHSVEFGLKPSGHGTLFTRHASNPGTSPPKEVTDREYEVLGLLAAGYPMKQIAYRLGITYRTVTFHKYRMMERLGITTNAGLMTYALQRSMAEKESVAA